jgi:hypothetical protein
VRARVCACTMCKASEPELVTVTYAVVKPISQSDKKTRTSLFVPAFLRECANTERLSRLLSVGGPAWM